MRFRDRIDAGNRLAAELSHLATEPLIILGLPRGGVPVALRVALALHAPLDVVLVRKLGLPGHRELAIGAIGEDGVRVLNDDVIAMAGVTTDDLAATEALEQVEMARRATRFRGSRPRLPLVGRTAVVVDDGIATGATARAACRAARLHGAGRVVLAVPVAPTDWVRRMGDAADEYVCVDTPACFGAVGEFYDDFSQTTDDEVVRCLRIAGAARP